MNAQEHRRADAVHHAAAVHHDEELAHAAVADHTTRAKAAATLGGTSAVGIPGGVRNVDMKHVNPNHRLGGQASRIAIGGKDPVMKTGSDVYDNAGHVLGHVGAGPIHVNAGQITEMKMGGKEREAVFEHGAHPGWVPIADFQNEKELSTLQKRDAATMDRGRHLSSDAGKTGTVRDIVDNAMPSKDNDLYTKPDQKSDTANHAHDYFTRGTADDPVVNLLTNLPTWTSKGGPRGERFGVAGDLVEAAKPGAAATSEEQFHDLGHTTDVPLFHKGSAKQAGHLDFDYGYVTNDDGKKRYGWLNDALLGAPHK